MTTATKLDKQEDRDLATLGRFEDIYKTQKASISRRLLGSTVKAETRAVAYLTHDEMEAVKGLANSIGINVSTLIRLTMTELASAFTSSAPDPRMG